MNSWWWFCAGSLAGVLATLAGTALMHGTPQRTTAQSTAGHPGMVAPATKAESMEVATAALQSRLDQQDGTPEEWQLLAQSYDFLGRPKEAAAARAHVRNANAGKQDWPDAGDVAALSRDVSASSPVPTSPQQTAPGAAADAAVVSGVVSLDSSFASLVQPDATLFVYAKSVDSPGAPLAVVRVAASHWPVSFRLDDSTAMLPTRKLSQFQRVIVEARVSRSGQVMPAAGDLYVESEVLNPLEGKKLTLVINRKIG
jgi:uncharacterized lipoprotein YbaY